MRDWLEETHGTGFELLRHFLLRFFDSDLVTAPGQTATALIGAFSIMLPWFPMIVGPLREKYTYFSRFPGPGPYRLAVRADELWLITLMMAAIGLLTAVKWQSLFRGSAIIAYWARCRCARGRSSRRNCSRCWRSQPRRWSR
jgi:hypothetical protein